MERVCELTPADPDLFARVEVTQDSITCPDFEGFTLCMPAVYSKAARLLGSCHGDIDLAIRHGVYSEVYEWLKRTGRLTS